MTDDAELIIVAFGTVARIAKTAVRAARAAGIRAGLFRPISLWPFPDETLDRLVDRAKGVLVAEMNAGQMLADVRTVVRGRTPLRFLGRMGGVIPLPDEITGELAHMVRVTHRGNGFDAPPAKRDRSTVL